LAFGLLVESYSAALVAALDVAMRRYANFPGVTEAVMQSALLGAFWEQVAYLPADRHAKSTVLGGPGVRPLMFRLELAARQAAADAGLSVSIDGRHLSGDPNVSRKKWVGPSEAAPCDNVGVLLESMLDSVTICGMVFSREQIELASEIATEERAAYVTRGYKPVGSQMWWSFGDAYEVVESWAQTLSILQVQDDDDAPSWAVAEHALEDRYLADSFDRLEMERHADSLLSRLSDGQRAAVEAVIMQGVTFEQYAAEIGVSKQAVHERVHRALGVMRGGDGGE
jgi:hypothetical protein